MLHKVQLISTLDAQLLATQVVIRNNNTSIRNNTFLLLMQHCLTSNLVERNSQELFCLEQRSIIRCATVGLLNDQKLTVQFNIVSLARTFTAKQKNSLQSLFCAPT